MKGRTNGCLHGTGVNRVVAPRGRKTGEEHVELPAEADIAVNSH